jgi:hypothetical protein
MPRAVVHAYNPSIQEEEAGTLTVSGAWATQ